MAQLYVDVSKDTGINIWQYKYSHYLQKDVRHIYVYREVETQLSVEGSIDVVFCRVMYIQNYP